VYVCAVQVIYVCCDRLLDIAGRSCTNETHTAVLFHTSNRLTGSTTALTRNSAGGASSHSSAYFAAESLKPPTLSTHLRAESRLQVVNLRPSVSCESFLPIPVPGRLSPLPPLTTSLSERHSPVIVQQSWAPSSRSEDHISLPGVLTAAGRPGASPAERVAIAMACTDYPPEARAKVEGYKQKLNTSPVEWRRLCSEDDAHVVSALMWNWIDELKVSQLSCRDGVNE